jgi:phosphatidylinositol glycan class B
MEFKRLEKRVYIISAALFFIAAVFSTGYHHFDEHFQILEFAGLKLGLTEAKYLPWEYTYQMRPALQPFLTYIISSILSFININSPFSQVFVLRLISAILSFYAIKSLYDVLKINFKNEYYRKLFLFYSFTLWFIFYNGVRYSSENWSGIFFVFALIIFLKKKRE